MPLKTDESTATLLAADLIRKKDGSTDGVNSALRKLGAHSEQASKLTQAGLDLYNLSRGWDALADEEPANVQVTVQTEQGDLSITLKGDRLPITSFEELVEFYEIDTDIWEPTSKLFNFWGSEKNPNFQVRANFKKNEYNEEVKYDRDAFRAWAKEWSPNFFVTKPEDTGRRGMLELVIADLHAGRYVNELTLEELLLEVREACHTLIDRAYAMKPLGEIHLVVLGDTFNSDNLRGTTTKGTLQVNLPDWREVFSRVRELVSEIAMDAADTCKAPVYIHILAGNHDRERSYYLADSLWGYFHKHPLIDVVLSNGIRHYIRWGANLIGLTHGDDVKPSDLVMAMYRDVSTEEVKFPVWHLGHFHTRKEEEIHGVVVKWFRSSNGPSEWEELKAFGHNQKDVVGILFDEVDGEIASLRVPLRV